MIERGNAEAQRRAITDQAHLDTPAVEFMGEALGHAQATGHESGVARHFTT